MDSQLMFKVADLTLHLMNGTIDEEGIAALQELLETNPLAVEYYIEVLWTHIGLDSLEGISCLHESKSKIYDINVWRALLQEEKTAPAVEITNPQESKVLIQKVERQKVVRKISKSSLFSLVAAAAAIVLIFMFAWSAPQETGLKVAVLSDSIHAKWADMDGVMEKGSPVFTSRKSLLLREGIVQLLFDNQARVTIESPAEFEIITGDQVKLNYGRLYATVPQSAIGFAVQTSSTRIIDLGTQFGVKADAEGVTELHVIKGKTSIITGQKNRRCLEVSEGVAKLITGEQGLIKDIPCRHDAFIRDINSDQKFVWRGQCIDLADLIGGGNGFGTGQTESSINPDTGLRQQGFNTREFEDQNSRCTYVKTDDLEFVDGVFVPDGGMGPVVVSSRGDVFNGCPDTNGQYFWNISNGFYIYDGYYRQILDGVKYGTRENPSISMHANSGITFDLEQIRALLPTTKLTAFRSLCGKSEPQGKLDNDVDLYVLVDGQVRFRYEGATARKGAKLVEIPLSGDDRFLTLIVVSKTNLDAQRALFARPEIVMCIQ